MNKQQALEAAPLMETTAVMGSGPSRYDRQQIARQIASDEGPDPGASPLSMALGLLCCPLTAVLSWYSLDPQQQAVVTSYGNYAETVKTPGIHFSSCFGRNIQKIDAKITAIELPKTTVIDVNGNPLIISAVVTYQVISAKRAILDVSNVHYFVRTQAETALKQGLSRFPYEGRNGEPCLKTEAAHIGDQLCHVLQEKVTQAGLVIHSFQLKEISYAPEIAAAMLKRQQAEAIIDARNTIVEGAVDICCHAVDKLAQRGVQLNQEEKARVVSNLLTVICSESDAVPTVPLA